MTLYIDTDLLGHLVRSKRGRRGLREVSAELKIISPSTLSRTEAGRQPGIEVFLVLCDWLGVSPMRLIKDTKVNQSGRSSNCDRAIQLIQDDPNLDPAVATVMTALIKAAYRDFKTSID